MQDEGAVKRVGLKLFFLPLSSGPLSRRKGRSARYRLSSRLSRETSTHDGPGCVMREDDVGRRLASSPEALLRQEVAGQIICDTKGVANAVGSFRPN